jgi:hypothetical protein
MSTIPNELDVGPPSVKRAFPRGPNVGFPWNQQGQGHFHLFLGSLASASWNLFLPKADDAPSCAKHNGNVADNNENVDNVDEQSVATTCSAATVRRGNLDSPSNIYLFKSVERYVETQPDKMLQLWLDEPDVMAEFIETHVKYASELQLKETCLLRYAQQELDRRKRGVNIRRMKSPYLNWRETLLEKQEKQAQETQSPTTILGKRPMDA